jgi:DNA-binding CsgD family transcriptional regulator
MTVASAVGDRTFSEIERLCRTELVPEEFSPTVAEKLSRAVPFDGYAVVTLDPLSGLATNFHFSEEMGSAEDARFFLENIYFEDDVLDYGWMARNRIAAMTLSEATGGELERALRYREYNGPRGFGPGVRAVLTVHGKPWGGLCLVRGKDVEDFSEREVEFLRRISPHLGAGLRAATLRFGARRETANGDVGIAFGSPASQAVGVLNLDHDGRVTRYTAAADHLLRELGAPENGRRDEHGLPMAVWAVVGAMRRTLGGKPDRSPSDIPCLRVRTRSGGWLTLQASLTEPTDGGPAETVVVIAPAGPAEMVQLHTTAYGLSAREREVVDLIVRGFSTRQISRSLYISESTVQGHLSHVFEKVGVKSRRELLKRLFLDNLSSRIPA